jgi:hypothetical protein
MNQTGWEDLEDKKPVPYYRDCTTCKLDSGSIEGYGQWMERGNGDYGLTMYPAKTRKDEGTEDEEETSAKIRMLIDTDFLEYKNVDYANNLVCEEYTGEGEKREGEEPRTTPHSRSFLVLPPDSPPLPPNIHTLSLGLPHLQRLPLQRQRHDRIRNRRIRD